MADLEKVKLHLRVDHDVEDGLIQSYIDAATKAAADYLNLEQLPEPVPAPVQAAILLAVADLYENREITVDVRKVDNRTYKRLLDPYRVMGM